MSPNICSRCGGKLVLVKIYSLDIGGAGEAIKCLFCAHYIWIVSTNTPWAAQYVPVEAPSRSGARLDRVIKNIATRLERER